MIEPIETHSGLKWREGSFKLRTDEGQLVMGYFKLVVHAAMSSENLF